MFKRPFAFLAGLASVATLGLVAAAPAAATDTIGTTVWLNCSSQYGEVLGSVRYTTATKSNGARKIAKVEWKSFTSPVKHIYVFTGASSGGPDRYSFSSSDGGHVAGYRDTSSALPYLQQPRKVDSHFTLVSGFCQVANRDY